MNYKKFVFIAVAGALGGALAVFESMISINILPGGKIGLSNIALIIILYLFSWRETICTAVLKSLIQLLLSGSVTGFFYSLCGGISAVFAMNAAKKHKSLSPVGAGICGAFSNNVVQTLIAAFIMANRGVLYYIGILGPVSIVTGAFTGYTGKMCVKYLNKKEIKYV